MTIQYFGDRQVPSPFDPAPCAMRVRNGFA